jgi:GTP-binding protein HflX
VTGTQSETAVVVKRVDSGDADPAELRDLARAAGHRVAAEVVQTRKEDPAYCIGEGKVAELAQVVEAMEAETVLFDNSLGPYQVFNLGTKLPDSVEVLDRFRLILAIFGQRAQTKKAQLQVELAELRYELPRIEAKTSLAKRDERPGFMGLGEYDESAERDIKKRISRIKEELATIEETDAHRREQRRESGFDLVALAGYTNAGKSTLLRRLAAELSVDENENRHPDLDRTAASEDRLFTTLGTTTRRLEMDARDVLLTDTVGFVSDLPHWLVESFKSTLSEVYRADLVLLVVDISDPIDEIHEKLVTSHDTLYERNEAPIVTVLNKVDTITETELTQKQEALSTLAPNPIAVSGKKGFSIEALKQRISDELPPYEHERLVIPMCDDTMSLISWVHDHGHVENIDYGEQVVVQFHARPAIIERARAKAGDLAYPA